MKRCHLCNRTYASPYNDYCLLRIGNVPYSAKRSLVLDLWGKWTLLVKIERGISLELLYGNPLGWVHWGPWDKLPENW